MKVVVGSRCIHKGAEKYVAEITGEVLILSDKSVVKESDISIIEPSAGSERKDDVTTEIEKAGLRSRIESLNSSSPATELLDVMGQVDPNMTIRAGEGISIDALKKALIGKALMYGKINPKKCATCGQNIPE